MHEDELPAIKRYLQFRWRSTSPPDDYHRWLRSLARTRVRQPRVIVVLLADEDTTSEDIAALRETDEDFKTGNVVTQEELEREFGA